MTAVNDINKQARRKQKWIYGGGAGLLWIVALELPAYSDGTNGLMCFFFGWLMISDNTFAFLAWLSNFPFLLGVLMYFFGKSRRVLRTATLLFLIAALLSFCALPLVKIEDPRGIPVVVHATYGTYLWMISCIGMLIAGLVTLKNAKPESVADL